MGRKNGVKTVFVQPQFSKRAAATIAKDLNAVVVETDPLDADFIVIETLQGRQVAIRPYAGHLDMEGIPDGMYQLRSLGKKGRTHRLGFFMLKR